MTIAGKPVSLIRIKVCDIFSSSPTSVLDWDIDGRFDTGSADMDRCVKCTGFEGVQFVLSEIASDLLHGLTDYDVVYVLLDECVAATYVDLLFGPIGRSEFTFKIYDSLNLLNFFLVIKVGEVRPRIDEFMAVNFGEQCGTNYSLKLRPETIITGAACDGDH